MQECMQILTYRDLGAMLYDDLAQACTAVANPKDEAKLPQPELDQPDYKAIAKIPRQQRRRVVIESFDMKYLPTALPEGWGATGAAGAAAGRTDKPAAGQCFHITVHGYLPDADAFHLIPDRFLRWLEDHKAQADRPYVLVVDTDKMTMSVRAAGAGAAGPGADPFGPGKAFGPAPAAGPGAGGADDWRNYLPTPPLENEDAARDTVFSIEWVVQLKDPVAIERNIMEANRPVEAPAPVPAPAATVTPAPATSPAVPSLRNPGAPSDNR